VAIEGFLELAPGVELELELEAQVAGALEWLPRIETEVDLA